MLPSVKNVCGDCGGKLGRDATRCRCGWVAPSSLHDALRQAAPSGPPCEVRAENCTGFALARVRTPTGFVNSCNRCYPEAAPVVPQDPEKVAQNRERILRLIGLGSGRTA